VGLLPLYIKLYDDSWPEMRTAVDAFRPAIRRALAPRGWKLSIARSAVAPEFKRVIRGFRASQGGCHRDLAPWRTRLRLNLRPRWQQRRCPVVFWIPRPLDDYGPRQNPENFFITHGIHGVQSMCNLLLRHKKAFQIEAGHWEKASFWIASPVWTRALV